MDWAEVGGLGGNLGLHGKEVERAASLLPLETPQDRAQTTRSLLGEPDGRKESDEGVLVPELGYADVTVHDGTLASLAFLELASGDTSPRRREQLRADLLTYCGRDTKAMVRIVEALREETSRGR